MWKLRNGRGLFNSLVLFAHDMSKSLGHPVYCTL